MAERIGRSFDALLDYYVAACLFLAAFVFAFGGADPEGKPLPPRWRACCSCCPRCCWPATYLSACEDKGESQMLESIPKNKFQNVLLLLGFCTAATLVLALCADASAWLPDNIGVALAGGGRGTGGDHRT